MNLNRTKHNFAWITEICNHLQGKHISHCITKISFAIRSTWWFWLPVILDALLCTNLPYLSKLNKYSLNLLAFLFCTQSCANKYLFLLYFYPPTQKYQYMPISFLDEGCIYIFSLFSAVEGFFLFSFHEGCSYNLALLCQFWHF